MLLSEKEILKNEYKINEKFLSKFSFLNSFNSFKEMYSYGKKHFQLPENIRLQYFHASSSLPLGDYRSIMRVFHSITEFLENSYPDWFLNYFTERIGFYQDISILEHYKIKLNDNLKRNVKLFRFKRYREHISNFHDNIFDGVDILYDFISSFNSLVERKWRDLDGILKNDWTLEELKKFCRREKITFRSSIRKEDLVEIILKSIHEWPKNPLIIEILSSEFDLKSVLNEDLFEILKKYCKKNNCMFPKINKEHLKLIEKDYFYYQIFENYCLEQQEKKRIIKKLKKIEKTSEEIEGLTLSLYQDLEPEIKRFIEEFYIEQIERGEFESVPYSRRKHDFITWSKRTEMYSSQIYYFKKSKSSTITDSFYDLERTLIRIKELMDHTEKLVKQKLKEDEEYCIKLSALNEVLSIYARITNDNYFSIYFYDTFLNPKMYFAVSTIKGYSILFDVELIPQEGDVLDIKDHDFLIRYIDEKFSYLKDWRISQLQRYCRDKDIVAPIRKIEIIKAIQDSNPIKRPYIVFIDRLIKKLEVFKDVILQFLDEGDIDVFEYHCLESLYISGRRDVNSIFNELKDLPKEEKINILFFNMKEYWSKDNDFTRIYSALPKKELQIKEYVKKNYPSQFDYIFPQFFKEQYRKVSPATIPKISMDFQKTFKKYKKSIDILGFEGEKYIHEMLKKENEGKPDTLIIWNNQREESSQPFDILLKVGDKKYYV